ncbi:MAG: hypothetical protein RL136_264 [Planctomycetota bacterium]
MAAMSMPMKNCRLLPRISPSLIAATLMACAPLATSPERVVAQEIEKRTAEEPMIQDAEAPAGDLLKGPPVVDSDSRTLVKRDLEGRLRRIEGRPEVAALAMLAIDPDVRDAAMRIVEERFEVVREHVIDQIDLLRESSDATRAGDRARAEELQREMIRRFDGWSERAPLLMSLAAVMPADAHAELTRMVDEYWSAWLASEAGTGNRAKPAELERRLAAQLLRGELTAVHNAALRPLQQRLDRIYEVAEVTDEQRAVIREAVIAHVKSTRLRQDADARLALSRAILAVLDDMQKERILAAALAGF